MTAQAIDDLLVGTFPASDPPAWTPGIARPAPADPARAADSAPTQRDTKDVRADVSGVSRPPGSEGRTFGQAAASLIGATGLALLVPLAILAIGTPMALGIRGALAVAEWIVAFVA
jgi:hypothetical protein